MNVFHFDGFRFDGVTSMLYHDHGLGSAFTGYDMYFSENTDTEAVTYLQLANELIHKINPNALTIAEDMSGMPGMCIPISDGGIGFDYRLSMGVPDLWIKTIKECKDEDWDIIKFWYDLTSRRPKEKNIGYSESHDQALVGDKTIMFRLCDADMYYGMQKFGENPVIDRGIALHKMIRLVTASLAGEGYLNFMGNEFGQFKEWNYKEGVEFFMTKFELHKKLHNFNKKLNETYKTQPTLYEIEDSWSGFEWISPDEKDNNVISFKRIDKKGNQLVFVANFSGNDYLKYRLGLEKGCYKAILCSDDKKFGGRGVMNKKLYKTSKKRAHGKNDSILINLPRFSGIYFIKQNENL
jgi:1,4-alpha-glucan branching enzyme